MGLRQRHANLIVGLRPASGLLTQEIVEPDMPALRLQTDYTYDSFGNRQTATVSGSDVATRFSTSGFDAKGQFNSVNTYALSQGESWQHDARFGYDSLAARSQSCVLTGHRRSGAICSVAASIAARRRVRAGAKYLVQAARS